MTHQKALFSPHFLERMIAFICLLAMAGCWGNEETEIISYKVPKLHSFPSDAQSSPAHVSKSKPRFEAKPGRILGAIVPVGNQMWFFKLKGPDEAVQSQIEPLAKFITSIRFDKKNQKPTWTLPDGWLQQLGSGFRFATLVINTSPGPLEVSVIPLKVPGDADEFLLQNVNRWRGEVGLSSVSKDQIYGSRSENDETQKIVVEGHTTTLVNFAGMLKPSRMSRGPFHPGGFPSAGRPRGPTGPKRPTTSPITAGPLKYDVPEGWKPGQLVKRGIVTVTRLAAFDVSDGSKTVEISVTAARGDFLANINRWRRQIKLGPITGVELDKQIKKIDVGSAAGRYIELVGPENTKDRQSILGVIVTHEGQTLFIKLKGDTALAAREKQRFETFVRSIRFAQPNGGGDGE